MINLSRNFSSFSCTPRPSFGLGVLIQVTLFQFDVNGERNEAYVFFPLTLDRFLAVCVVPPSPPPKKKTEKMKNHIRRELRQEDEG